MHGETMSRIGKQPITVPSAVKVDINGPKVSVSGPRGNLSREVNEEMRLHLEDGSLTVTRPSDEPRHRAMHGLTRALIANMVTGVDTGFRKTLELVGVGYRAQMQGSKLVLALGFSHPVEIDPPAGITFSMEGPRVIIEGIDKEQVGQVAADIRKLRPPEPYLGKGVRYQGEVVRRKAGKSGKGR
jgi:large subunit ribosomal protein L6